MRQRGEAGLQEVVDSRARQCPGEEAPETRASTCVVANRIELAGRHWITNRSASTTRPNASKFGIPRPLQRLLG